MPRRSRRKIVGKWEQVDKEAREDELRDLEHELHRKEHGGRRNPKQAGTPERKAPREVDTDDSGSDG